MFHHFEICTKGPVTLKQASPKRMILVVFSCIMSKKRRVATAMSHWIKKENKDSIIKDRIPAEFWDEKQQ